MMTSAPLKLAWRPRAQLDRESIAVYLGIERQNPEAALTAMERIDSAIQHVLEFPDSGGRIRMDQLEYKEYRTITANPYTVYYRYSSDTLVVYRILHQRQNINIATIIDF